jgi:site-specific recombinase XerD
LAEFQAVHPLEESTWNRFAAELLSESTPANRTGRIAELRHYQRWLDENGGGSILDQDMDNLHLYLMSLDEGKRKYQSGTIRRFFAWLQGEKRPAYQSFRPNPLVKDPTRPSGRAANYRKRGPDKKPRRRSRRRNPNQRIGGVAAFSQQIATEFREQFPEESALFRRFIKHIYPNERRSHTPSARLSDLRQVQRILARANAGSILSYTPETAEKLITFLLSNGYRGSTLIVNRFLKYATEQGVLNSNPVIESAYE